MTATPSPAVEAARAKRAALEAHYEANAVGHDSTCRRRIPPGMFTDGRALDPDRCERCRYLVAQLEEAHAANVAAGRVRA